MEMKHYLKPFFYHFSAWRGSFPKYDLFFVQPKVMLYIGIGDAMNVVCLWCVCVCVCVCVWIGMDSLLGLES